MNWFTDWFPNLELLAALAGMVVFAITYARWANWRETPAGRALMYLMISMMGILTMAFAHLLLGANYALADLVRIVVYGAFTFSIWRLVRVLYQAQRLNWASWLGLRRKTREKKKNV